jgi:hypothetical protein
LGGEKNKQNYQITTQQKAYTLSQAQGRKTGGLPAEYCIIHLSKM